MSTYEYWGGVYAIMTWRLVYVLVVISIYGYWGDVYAIVTWQLFDVFSWE
jgi:hypothetical protein